MDLPPGPGTLRTLAFVREPFAFLDTCARRYGDWFTVRFPGFHPFVFTSDPRAVREAFTGDPEQLRAGEANAPLAPFVGAHSLLLLDGAAHHRERLLLLPPLHGDRMHTHTTTMQRIADDTIDRWPVGRPFAFHPCMRAVTFEVILATVLGTDEASEDLRQRLRDCLGRLFAIFGSPIGTLFSIPWTRIDLGPRSPWGRVLRLRRELDEVLFAELARRRAAGTDRQRDVLSLLLAARDERGVAMTDAAVRDEVVTLLLAGNETTAASLAWVMNRLLGRPDVLQALCDELRAGAAQHRSIADLPLLDAVVKETSRLDPVVPNVGRRLATPTRIAEWMLPAGAVLAPCIYLVHRRPDLWPDADQFRPERFLDATPNPHAFFPFGGGPRRCIGAALATHEMKVVLRQVLLRCELAPAPGYRARVVRRGIAFAPSEGMPVVMNVRRPVG